MGRSGSDKVLLLCEDPGNAAGFTQLFRASGFPVQCSTGGPGNIDPDEIGAVVHLALSEQALQSLPGQELDNIRDEELILIEGGKCEEDYYCTVQLTRQASSELRSFVRTLWAMFNTT